MRVLASSVRRAGLLGLCVVLVAGCLLTSSFDGLQGGVGGGGGAAGTSTSGTGSHAMSSASTSSASSSSGSTAASSGSSSGGADIMPRSPVTWTMDVTANTPVDVPAPDAKAGDFMLMVVNVQPDPSPMTPSGPAGWAADGDATYPSCSNFRDYFFHRVATASEPTSYALTLPTDAKVQVAAIPYSGVDPSFPVDNQTTGSVAYDMSVPGWKIGTLKTYAARDMLVLLISNSQSDGWTPPTGMTAEVSTPELGIFDELQPMAGETGTLVAMSGGNYGCGAYRLVALKHP